MIEIQENQENKKTAQSSTPLLHIHNFSVTFDTYEGRLKALENIDLNLANGESLGIIGESGSGKTTLATAIMGLISDNAELGGTIYFDGNMIIDSEHFGKAYQKLKRRERKILSEKLILMRWKEISMVFQGSMNAFNPAYTIEKQIGEVFKIHTNLTDKEIEERSLQVIESAGLNRSALKAYPHELSGGMKQRAVIAMALALSPKLVIADEPTTGLDVITQAKIISELKSLRGTSINSMIVISHDVGVVSQLSDRVVVLYSGRIMEIGPTWEVYRRSLNPYTRALLSSYPSIDSTKSHIDGIPGALPDPLTEREGCYFAPRCKYADSICYSTVPKLEEISPGRFSRCHFANKFLDGEMVEEIKPHASEKKNRSVETEVLKTDELTEYFSLRTKTYGQLYGKEEATRIVRAVDHIDMDIKKGEIFGVVGESGSGKTTLGRVILKLLDATSGKVLFYANKNMENSVSENFVEIDVTASHQRSPQMKLFRRETQLIFQDPYDSIDPKQTVFNIVQEPIIAHRITSDPIKITEMVNMALEIVRLNPPESYSERYPHELSGGERQRVAAARALVLRPEFLVADEPISMLDVSLRAGFMNLLLELRNQFGITVMFITHDLASARYLCDRIMVMYLGVSVESGDSEQVMRNPLHPYTKALIKAVPKPNPNWDPSKIEIKGEIGNAIDVPKGCRFYRRCPYARDICKNTPPPRKEPESGHWYVCHFTQDELSSYRSFNKADNEE
ncbi:MAG: ABC transporter ATP-binding protein [Candidatus Thermoplasmatota archaeon]|jgi:peptide/nickel transport system ATP-binding protein|nr:ABC transporter ATP-binding protein [Candidatus Thermoplasmatota archaeon]WMT43749.1 MAG: ABC transporter ATP-binding protein [Cuniculiplasma divulgatum]